jgi:hypothetical protein
LGGESEQGLNCLLVGRAAGYLLLLLQHLRAHLLAIKNSQLHVLSEAYYNIWHLCNRTDQIIRAQVQKQAPKRSNFRT